jgi:hypothetical protein
MMGVRYPVVRLVEAQRYVLRRQSGELGVDDRPEFEEEGASGDETLLPVVNDLCDRITDLHQSSKARFTSGIARDRFEGSLAVQLHERLREFPARVLTDDDFWRYLAVRGLYEFIAWRDGQSSGSPALASFGANSPRVNYDCVPFRMFVRADIASIVAESGPQDMDAMDISSVAGTDLWRSHILRSQSSFSPNYVRLLLEHHERGVLPALIVRDLAKRVKRVRSNVLIEALEAEDTRTMFDRAFVAANGAEE